MTQNQSVCFSCLMLFCCFQDNYGRKEPPECAQRVKELYRELDLQKVYAEYEASSYQKLMGLIEEQAAAASLPKGLFVEYANRIYKRNA